MVCKGLEVMKPFTSFVDYFIFPTTCFYYFYAVILFALFIIIAFLLYNREREQLVQADMISSLGVSALVILILSAIGTLITSSNGIPMIQRDIMIYVVALWIPITAIWFFKK